MIERKDFVAYCDSLLEIEAFRDYCPNGLQVQGRAQIHKLVTGVTASQALLDRAVEQQADAVLVHHGYFWKGDDPRVVGGMHQRLKTLLEHDISLLAYHLPLDAHPIYGNNVQLAHLLSLSIEGQFGDSKPAIGLFGRLQTPLSPDVFAARIEQQLGRKPLLIEASERNIETIAWCSGAAQGYLPQAVALGVDAYLSGEISEQTVHVAREAGVHYISAGHHATERGGVRALGEHLASRFALEVTFVDIDNPV